MRKLLWLSLLLAIPAHAQKAPVYGCSVLAVDADVVTYSISTDGIFSQKQSAPHPANETDGVKDLCRREIARLTAKNTQPITVGVVSLADPIVQPVIDPNQAVKDQFTADYAKLKLYLLAISQGLINAADKNYGNQLNTVSTEFINNEDVLLPLLTP